MIKKIAVFLLAITLACVGYAQAIVLLDYSDPNTQQGDGGFEGSGHWTFQQGTIVANGDGANPDAWQGTHCAYIYKFADASLGYGVTSTLIDYTPGTEITYSGYYYLNSDLTANNWTRLKVEYYTSAGAFLDAHEGDKITSGSGAWTPASMTSTHGTAEKVKFTVLIYGDAGTPAETDKVYWDGLTASAVPEPSVMFLFGTGLMGLLGAGWRKFRKQ